MPPRLQQQSDSWSLVSGGQVLDLETAVKDGILGSGGGASGGGIEEKVDVRKIIDSVEGTAADDEDDVPSVFICPISLDPMIDPVTLCTGQTYERSNIQKWLSMGHRTCPTTMQELWDETLTPNRTLHHLIHTWFSQRYLRTTIKKKRSEDVGVQVIQLLDSLRRVKGQTRLRALKDLAKLLAFHSPSAKKALAGGSGVSLLSSLLGPFTSHAVGAEVLAILVNLHLDSDARENLMHPPKISLIVDMLNEGIPDTKINCARLILTLMQEDNFRSEILSTPSLLVGLLRLVRDKRHQNGVAIGIALLNTICNHKHHHQQHQQQQEVWAHMLRVGAVPQLVKVLPHLAPHCLDSALQILDELSSIPQGRLALKDCSHTIPNLVKILMRVSEACTQYALSILWAVCKLAPEECASVAVDAGLAAKLLLVIQSGCGPSLKQRSAELLKLCSLNYTPTLFISKCKLTRTIQ